MMMTPQQRFERMATYLNLTPQQREQAQALMDQARQASEPIKAQLKQNHQLLADAIKTGKSEAELDRLATQQGVLVGQLTAIHAKAMQKGYAMLTPEQKQKADQMRQHFMMGHGMGQGMMGQGRGFGPGGPATAPPAPNR
jgi:Spy/CpxP family protein refolding chaperone